MVYNEGNPEVKPGNLPVLRLDAYDFIRVCSRHKGAYISDTELPIKLDGLYHRIAEEVFDRRREIAKINAELEEQAPTAGEADVLQEAPSAPKSPRPAPPPRKKARID